MDHRIKNKRSMYKTLRRKQRNKSLQLWVGNSLLDTIRKTVNKKRLKKIEFQQS